MHTYQLGAPMSWGAFKVLPDDLKREYVTRLRNEYNVSGPQLAIMMGVSAGLVARTLRELGLSEDTRRVMSYKQREVWDRFCNPITPAEEPEEVAPIECEEEENEVMDTKVEIPKTHEKKSGCSINSGILQFTGNAPDIAIALMKFLGDREYKISVEFSELAEE